MSLHQCPDAFWDFGLSYVLTVRQFIVRNAANNRSPIETITGDTPDISEIMDFDFYQWIMYRDQLDKDVPIKMGRWLGIAHDVGSALTYWILKPNCQIIARSTVRPLLADEIKDETGKQMRLAFTNAMNNQYKDFDPDKIQVFDLDELEEPTTTSNVDDSIGDAHTKNDNNNKNDNDNDNETKNDKVRGPDLFQNAEIYLPHGDRNEIAKVIGQKRDNDGNYVGRAHKQPMLDSRIFTVRFPDGEEKDIAYNMLAEHLFSQVDSEGNQYRLFSGIINHRRINPLSINPINTVY